MLYTEKYYEYTNWTREESLSNPNLDSIHQRDDTGTTRINADNVINFIESVNDKNCRSKTKEEFHLKGMCLCQMQMILQILHIFNLF